MHCRETTTTPFHLFAQASSGSALQSCVPWFHLCICQTSWKWLMSLRAICISQQNKDGSSSDFSDKVSWNPPTPPSRSLGRASIRPQSVESQTTDLSEKQFTVICRRALDWCISIVPNMPIHHQAAGGFWVCSDQICTKRWWGACWFWYRKVQIQLFVTSSLDGGGRGGEIQSVETEWMRQRLRQLPYRPNWDSWYRLLVTANFWNCIIVLLT